LTMVEIILIYVFGVLGILGHWATRYIQSRTTSSVGEYLKSNIVYTFASLSAGFASSSGLVMVLTPGMTVQQIIVLLGAAYTAGYTCDSKFNKDKPKETKEAEKPEIKVIEAENHENEDINDRLARHHQS
jgi:uncharacterized membrane protein YesL